MQVGAFRAAAFLKPGPVKNRAWTLNGEGPIAESFAGVADVNACLPGEEGEGIQRRRKKTGRFQAVSPGELTKRGDRGG